MKKINKLLSIVLCLAMVLSFATVTFAVEDGPAAEIIFDDVTKRTEFSTERQVWEQDGITVTNEKASSTSNVADYSNPARFYKNSSLTIEYPGMKNLVVFCQDAKYATALESSVGNLGTVSVTVNSNMATITLAEAVDSITITLTGGQVRAWSIAVYTGDIPTEEEPEVPENNDPAADSTLTIAEAIALGASKEHDTYTEGKYYVVGEITEVYNTKYGNMKIKDAEGNILTIYGTYSADGSTRYDAMDVKPVAGDTVKLYGIIGQYNGTPQMKNGWVIEHMPGETEPTPPEVPEDPAADSTLTITEAIALGASKEHNTYTEGKYYVVGEITEVYNTKYGNMKIKDAEGNILTIYGTYSADGSTRYDAMDVQPVAGDTVKLYGIIGQYNSTPQMKNGWVIEHMPAVPVCEHANTKVEGAKDATCTEAGYTGDTYCTDCGEKIATGTAIAATGHSYVDGKCTVCGAADPDYVPSCGHANTKVEGAKDATCTEAGYTGNIVCIDCGETVTASTEIPARGHNYEGRTETVVKEPTCTEEGEMMIEVYCTTCNEPMSGNYRPIETLPHNYVDGFCSACGAEEPPCAHVTELQGKVDATCTENGYTGDEVCTLCGETVTYGTVIEAMGHIYANGNCIACGAADPDYVPVHPADHIVRAVKIAPTCTKWGCTLYICLEEGCSYSTSDSYVPALGHSMVAPTCENAGYCSVCNEPGEAALGHTWVAPTCTENGYCSVCGEAGEAALGHDLTAGDSKAPTCTEPGFKGHKCTRCDYTEEYETPAMGHNWQSATCATPKTCANCGLTEGDVKNHAWGEVIFVSAPTCTEKGYNKVTCADCGATSHLPVAALGHTEEIIPAVEATCTTTGLTEGKKCSVCGEILVAQEEVAVKAHSYEAKVTAPTCTEAGYTTYTCVCGDTYTADEVAALGHTWGEGVVTTEPTEEATGVMTYTCACGETKTEELPKLEHVHKHQATVTAPTCEEGGYTTYSCACGDTYVADQVVALGHTYDAEGNCTTCGSPKTGDVTIVLMILASMVMMAGAAIVIGKKKYF